MNPLLRNILCNTVLIYCLSSNNVIGQVTSSTVNKKVKTAYSTVDTIPGDSIFVFYQRPNRQLGSLTAKDTITARFEWSKYDTIAKTFAAPFFIQDDVKASSIGNLTEGGYKVTVIDTVGRDTSFVAWVAFDSIHITITKDKENYVPYFNSTCDYFDLIVVDSITSKAPRAVNFRYFNPYKDTACVFVNAFKFEWFKESMNDPFATDKAARHRVTGDDIPYEDTKYYVSVSDKFGLTQTDMVTYKSIVPKAKFKIEPDTSGLENSAPLKVTFIDSSKNAVRYTWYMGDGTDTLYVRTPPIHTYYSPDADPSTPSTEDPYTVTLIVESNEQCTDSVSDSIVVKAPTLKVPNVFNPERGNFKFSTISLHYYKFVIFTRWGKKIYEEEHYDNSEPGGWDGKIGNNYAAEGIYYYVIEVRHWDPYPNERKGDYPIKNKGRYSGFFYLFRSNN